MRRNHEQLQISASRQAFTLVEMLIVCAIIIILAVLTLIVVNKVMTSAKETKTRATIQKLDVAMQQIFETYDEKFHSIKKKVNVKYPEPQFDEEERQKKIATHFIRDLMRMEMPQSWAEVYNSKEPDKKLGPIKIEIDGTSYAVDESPVLEYYWQAYNKVAAGKTPSRAALLFLIIQNLNPEALEAFHGSEIKYNEEDGLFEFVDAWGKPIYFLRWAPAFPGSDLQPDVLALAKYFPTTNGDTNRAWWNRAWWKNEDQKNELLSDAMARASADYPDPFDERANSTGWFLYPLIYSAGPDGKYGITSEEEDKDTKQLKSPTVEAGGILDPFAFPYGMPGDFDGNGKLNHFDNIHNHRWYKSF